MDLFDSPESAGEDNHDPSDEEEGKEEDVGVPWVPPQMDDAAKQKLLVVLKSRGPDSDDFDAEVLDYLHHSDETTLSRLLTIDNTKGLLTEWDGDPVNEPCGLTGLHAMDSFPVEIVQSHAKGILAHADEIIDNKYGWHEHYCALLEDVIDALAAKHCIGALATFVSETLLPRIRDAAKEYAEACNEDESEDEEQQDDESEDEKSPDLFQGELLDTAARMGEIALKCAGAFENCIAELSKILEPCWKDIEACGVYKERLFALRRILSGKSGSEKRQATESPESTPDIKKARSESS